MKKLHAALVAGVFTMFPMTAVQAQAPTKVPDCKAAAAKLADCKKAGSMTAECKAAETTMGMAECKKADSAAPVKKEKKGGC